LFLSANLAERLGHIEFKTLLLSSSAFYESQIFFSVPGHPTSHTNRIGTSTSFRDKKFFFLRWFFSSHHASGTVSTSSAKIFFQETRAEYQTLAAHQVKYHPQDSQRTEGFQVQERAAEQFDLVL
jgi:hypothetical protein